jgi:hypothetical protein
MVAMLFDARLNGLVHQREHDTWTYQLGHHITYWYIYSIRLQGTIPGRLAKELDVQDLRNEKLERIRQSLCERNIVFGLAQFTLNGQQWMTSFETIRRQRSLVEATFACLAGAFSFYEVVFQFLGRDPFVGQIERLQDHGQYPAPCSHASSYQYRSYQRGLPPLSLI